MTTRARDRLLPETRLSEVRDDDMPFDAIFLAAVKTELEERIVGSKIDKVQQPERDIVVLSLRGGDMPRCKMLISAGTGDMRVHLTENRFDNPDSPPMFCMLLRKHLTGARIIGISQPPAERVLSLALEASDALGIKSEKKLIMELMGRISNIVLTDSNGLIIDCLRRMGGELSDKRAVLPGLMYRPPAAQEGKLDPLRVRPDEWKGLFREARGLSCDQWLLRHFRALSPLICREITWRAYGDVDFFIDSVKDGGEALSREFFALTGQATQSAFEAWMVIGPDSGLRDFSYTGIKQYEGAAEASRVESFSEMLDFFYTRSQQLKRMQQRASAMSKTVKTARDRIARKLAAQKDEIIKAADRDYLRECGDIITANLHRMKKGQIILKAVDFYAGIHASNGETPLDDPQGEGPQDEVPEESAMREIKTDPLKTPQQNAAQYYKDYTKAKNAERYLTEQIKLGEDELAYLDSVLEEIARAESELDMADIRRELIVTGYLKEKKIKEKLNESAPMRFESSSGISILAGRNNTQNDKLTLKTASRTDIWMHTQKIHGSHVIISCSDAQPDETSIHEAAAIAAYYSTSRSGGKVPVDYTLVRHVKKPPGGRPGMVIYTDYKTIIASADEELVNRLRKE